MSTTQRSESINAFFDGYVNSKTTLKQFVEKYEKAIENKIEKEWQANARYFSQRTSCCTNFAMEKQVKEVYTICKFQEFQQELMDKIYCKVYSCGGLEYEVVENDEKSKEKTFTKLFLKNMTVKFIVHVQCLNVNGLFANTPLQSWYVAI